MGIFGRFSGWILRMCGTVKRKTMGRGVFIIPKMRTRIADAL